MTQSRLRPLTHGPSHHFFGYYGIPPWDGAQARLLCLESDFQDHIPAPEEPARVGLVDADSGAFSPVAETHAWNVQQGAMLHWDPRHPNRRILFNDRRSDDATAEIVSVIHDLESGSTRDLPRAINAVSHDGRHALSLTYGRLSRCRRVVGYRGVVDPHANDPHPVDDGVFLMDLETGEARLVVSIAEAYERLVPRHPELRERHLWFNHVVFSRGDARFLFLARTTDPDGTLQTGMFTANLDGSELREVIPYGRRVSHFDWRDDRHIVATCSFRGLAKEHVLLTDGADDAHLLGEGLLRGDGHCCFSPNGAWLLTDERHDETLERSLVLYHPETGAFHRLGRYPMFESRYISGDLRCDLHPRWNRTGDALCIDALASDGTRQLHVGPAPV